MSQPQGFHEDFARDEAIEGSSDRGFGLVFTGFCALVGVLKFYNDTPSYVYWLGASAGFLAAALLAPGLLAPLNRLWTRLAMVLYKIMNPLTMGLLFFFVITPMGIAMRAFGTDFLKRRLDASQTSYWVVREPPGPAPDTMKRQF
ncbi:MAG: hypothetical protein HY059_15040 [Proteobacteria bacterium]|nr:hypothetical protein [Pseudomonadota bacterium]